MDNEILFTEKQKFNQWWLWLIIVGVNCLLLYGVKIQVIGGKQFGSKPMSDTGLILATGLFMLLSIMMMMIRLDTKIKKDGIYVRFFPIHLKFKHYTWNSLKKCYVRHYAALTEYGGWGLRLKLFGKGKAYTISGDKGLQLEFTTEKKLLIGTNKTDKLTATLTKIGQIKQ